MPPPSFRVRPSKGNVIRMIDFLLHKIPTEGRGGSLQFDVIWSECETGEELQHLLRLAVSWGNSLGLKANSDEGSAVWYYQLMITLCSEGSSCTNRKVELYFCFRSTHLFLRLLKDKIPFLQCKQQIMCPEQDVVRSDAKWDVNSAEEE